MVLFGLVVKFERLDVKFRVGCKILRVWMSNFGLDVKFEGLDVKFLAHFFWFWRSWAVFCRFFVDFCISVPTSRI